MVSLFAGERSGPNWGVNVGRDAGPRYRVPRRETVFLRVLASDETAVAPACDVLPAIEASASPATSSSSRACASDVSVTCLPEIISAS